MLEYLSIIITIIPGLWILWNYLFKRSFAPKVKMTLTGEVIAKDFSGQRLLRTCLGVSNIGEVRLKASQIRLTIRGIKRNSLLKIGGEEILYQVDFDQKIYQEELIPFEWEYTFVDPGITQDYQYSILIPKDIEYLLIEGKIYFKSSKDFQLTSIIIKLDK